MGPTGTLYGATCCGGSSGNGTVFSLTSPATGSTPWVEDVLHNFAGGSSDGSDPCGGVTLGANGVLYGVTQFGGPAGAGTVYSVSFDSTSWTEKVLYIFSGGSDGAFPCGGVVVGNGGAALYGTTFQGGSTGFGTIFSLTPTSSGPWTETVLYNFTGGIDGRPGSPLVIGGAGVLYSTTETGGTSSFGAVYSLAPPATPGDSWIYDVLWNFTGISDGSEPASVVIGNGRLYGVTFGASAEVCTPPNCGTVFQLAPD